MRGIIRPCRAHLGPELHARWQAHLCGLCLTLRDVAGQPERALTGYDVLLLSVLVEAQAGSVETTTAAPCPLRGFTRATVVASSSDAGRLAAAGALLAGGAGLLDKIDDGDLPRAVRRPAGRVAARLARTGTALAEEVGLDPRPVLDAPAAAARAERTPDLAAMLATTGAAVSALFAHTAVVAGRPANGAALAECGQAFGKLVHLLDAVEDREADRAAGHVNPLEATGTDNAAARTLADQLVARVQAALAAADLADRALVDVLLGRELWAAVHRALPLVPQQRGSTLMLWAALVPAVFIGGGNCGGGRRRRRRGYDIGPDGYPAGYGYPPGYGSRGYRRMGPSCGEMLACNCCANLACNACCCCGEDCGS